MADDNGVGYGNPPKHTRWKKGQSGNPRGRRKGSRGLKTDLLAELSSKMEIQMNGQKVSGTKQQLMLKTLSHRAAAGNVVAIKAIIELALQVVGAEDRGRDAKRLTGWVRGKEVLILDVWRGKVEFPELKRSAVKLASRWRVKTILIEDKSSGQQLIQELRAASHRDVPWPIPRIPEQDKYSRAAGVSPMVEAGQLLLPREARWLADFRSELLAFPNGRNDDQVDALSQLLSWVRRGYTYPDHRASPPETPGLYDDDPEGWDDEGDSEEDEDGFRW